MANLPGNISNIDEPQKLFNAVRSEISRAIVGQERLIERLLVALLSDGHVLLEGVPGLAKTKTLSALTRVVNGQMSRVQFTPDLLPSDVIGTEVYRPQTGEFVVRRGPIFTNFLLADEINRAPAKVQSALLQAMQEGEVTIGDQTFSLPKPFLVLATQNPIEQEGTYPLPEAQLDRFLMKVKVFYPRLEEELKILQGAEANQSPRDSLQPVLELATLTHLQRAGRELVVDPRIDRYIVALIQATREPSAFGMKGLVEWGASPRASLALKSCARSLAFVRGLKAVTPEEIKDIAPDVLRHRILVSFEAESRSLDSDEVIRVLLKTITVP